MVEKRYPYAEALNVAQEIVESMKSTCVRIEIAGSLRRKKADVGDIEILYIPRIIEQDNPESLFEKQKVDLAEWTIEALLEHGILDLRKSVTGKTAYGPLNKLMVHIASRIPVDLFATTEESWYNYLVCRTGPAELNKAICNAAIAKGWHWKPYGNGFSRMQDDYPIHSEREVFDFVGLPYLEPEQRR